MEYKKRKTFLFLNVTFLRECFDAHGEFLLAIKFYMYLKEHC